MKKITKGIIIVLAFIVMAAIATGAFLTNEMQYRGLRQTGNHSDEGAVLITDTFQRVNQYPNYNIWELNLDSDETYVYAMIEYERNLFVGTGPDGKIYSYDGDSWALSYDSSVTEIYSLETFKGSLYAGGSQGRIYVYDGSSWSLAQSLSANQIWALKVFGDSLYAGTGEQGKVFVYDGSSWSESYDSSAIHIYSLGVLEGVLYAGSGDGGVIYEYDGTTWSVNYDSPEEKILSLNKYKGKLYAGTGTDGEVYVYGEAPSSLELDAESSYDTNTTYSTTSNPIANAFDEDLNTYAALSNRLGHLDAITGAGSPNYLNGANDVYISEDVAYVASILDDALTTFNVTNASNIIHMGNISGAGTPNYLNYAQGIYVSEDVAYVVSGLDDALTTFNVTNASNIIHMGNISGAGTPNYLDYAESIYVSGDVAYVVSSNDDSLTTFNVTNASNIIHMGNISGEGSPNYLNEPSRVYVSGDVAYVVSRDDDALTTFNVTNASNIILMDAITGSGSPNYLGSAWGLYVSGGVAYVGSYSDNALTTFNVSNASNIIHMEAITGIGSPNYLRGARDVYVSGNIAYVASYLDDALTLFDISDNSTITHIDAITGAGAPNYLDTPRSVWVSGNVAYVTADQDQDEGDPDNSLTSFQIPSDDREVNWSFTIPSNANTITLSTKITEWFDSGGLNISCYNYTGTKWNYFTRRVSATVETGSIPSDCFSGQTNLQLRGLLTNNSIRRVYGINFYGSYLDIVYTGVNWSVSYDGADQNVYSLEQYNGNLYAGTGRTGSVYMFDGTTWSEDYSIKDISPMYVRSLAEYQGGLFAGTGEEGGVYSYTIKPRQEITISDITLPSGRSLPVNITTTILIPVNISNYGFKEYTANLIDNATHKSTTNFNSRLEHLILTPNESDATYRFKLTQDSDGTIIYDQTGLDFTGRTGVIVNIPLIGFINVTIQNASQSINTSVKIVYT